MEEFGRRGDDHFYEGLSHVSETPAYNMQVCSAVRNADLKENWFGLLQNQNWS